MRHILVCFLLLAAFCLPGRSDPEDQIPAELTTPRVNFGSGFVHGRKFAECPIGTITDIKWSTGKGTIAAAGQAGGAILTSKGAVLSTVTYSSPFADVSLVPLGNSGRYDYLSRGSWSSVSLLFGPSGQTLWSAPEGQGVNDAAAADFLGNGALQLVVAYNGATGISLFNRQGSKIWNEPDGDVWHVEAYRDSPKAAWRIISIDEDIVVRNTSGKTLSRSTPPSDLSDFSLCHWPSEASPCYLLADTDAGIQVISQTGKLIMSFTAPTAKYMHQVVGYPVRLGSKKSVYFAVLGTPMWQWDRSVLWIFDSSGTLMYQETLPEKCSSLAVLPSPSPGKPETLLVGGTDHIWSYR